MTQEDSILDDLFHGCAFAAFVERAVAEQNWPDPTATNALACLYYEQEIAAKRHCHGANPHVTAAITPENPPFTNTGDCGMVKDTACHGGHHDQAY